MRERAGLRPAPKWDDPQRARTRAGLPAATAPLGMSRVTTLIERIDGMQQVIAASQDQSLGQVSELLADLRTALAAMQPRGEQQAGREEGR